MDTIEKTTTNDSLINYFNINPLFNKWLSSENEGEYNKLKNYLIERHGNEMVEDFTRLIKIEFMNK